MLTPKPSDKFLLMPEIMLGCEYCKYAKIHPEDSDCLLAEQWRTFWAERIAYRSEFLDIYLFYKKGGTQ